jgi:hypothetical protein
MPAERLRPSGERGSGQLKKTSGPRLVRLAAGPIGPKVKENSFPNKNLIFEYTKALEICRRRFRRNFDMKICPKIFWAFLRFLE